jgi:HD-GYP domain-containing protein (c-di-GMP phosphodiesterase class II)
MIAGEQVIGVIGVESEVPEAFNELDERLLDTLAKITANAIHRNQLRRQTEHQLERLAALRAIDQAISSSFDLRITLDIFLKNAVTQLGADAALLLRADPAMNSLEYAAEYGFISPGVKRIRLSMSQEAAGRAALERRLIRIPDLRSGNHPAVHPQVAANEHFVTYHAVPLVVKGQVKGVLEVFQRSYAEPGGDWMDFLETLAGQAAIAIDNNQLFESLQRTNSELGIAYDETIEGWSKALDMRDHETEGHTQRVTLVTQQLGFAEGLTGLELVHLRRGALLHDIGKMGVPDNILLKPGELNEEEMGIMRQHPRLAYEMLAPVTYLRPALDIPYCHHEKWDGSGYPRGLKGEQIPLAARLFTVVDVWDALRSDRPYRRKWPNDRVLEYIHGQAGTRFDPRAVETFFQVLEKMQE